MRKGHPHALDYVVRKLLGVTDIYARDVRCAGMELVIEVAPRWRAPRLVCEHGGRPQTPVRDARGTSGASCAVPVPQVAKRQT